MSTYSVIFWQGNCPTAETTIVTVPTGHTYVLRDAEWFNAGGVTADCQVQTSVPGFGVAVVARVNGLESAHGAQWQGRVALPAGSSLQLAAPVATLYLYLGGYDLAD